MEFLAPNLVFLNEDVRTKQISDNSPTARNLVEKRLFNCSSPPFGHDSTAKGIETDYCQPRIVIVDREQQYLISRCRVKACDRLGCSNCDLVRCSSYCNCKFSI